MTDPDNDAPRTLRLPDGRRLAWCRYGRPGGTPVLFFHGFPGTHSQALLVHDAAEQAGIALYAFDRPGFGGSDPAPHAWVDETVGDVAALADHLGLRRFGVMAVSCGAPHALACARRLGARVSALVLLGGAGPMTRPEARQGQLPLLRLMFRLAAVHPWLVSPLLAMDWLMLRMDAIRAVRQLASLMAAPDRRLLEDDARIRAVFARSLADAYAQGLGGALREAQRVARWSDAGWQCITSPVLVMQGGQDRHVPPALGRWMAGRLAQGRLQEHPQEGHLSIVVHQFDACAGFLRQHA